ncbi:hypothetical protein [Leptospira sp. GIMC2001]|uniref:hypothetical protein n=1 Tax=Leptospira sp. GIMC2001 TaxID=1513297 RepID=UPI00234BEE7C|nr:hypothetical protein [Leptospira sp. GIMC2001]WCL50066.1 hypothetical protein O4O04_04405 [Leptospira sp. GIMC2001]
MYTLKRFEKVELAHIFNENNPDKRYACGFDESKYKMEKSSLKLDLSKIRIAVAKSANANSAICGICVGALYSN